MDGRVEGPSFVLSALAGGTSDVSSIEGIDGGLSPSHSQLQEPLEEEKPPHGHSKMTISHRLLSFAFSFLLLLFFSFILFLHT